MTMPPDPASMRAPNVTRWAVPAFLIFVVLAALGLAMLGTVDRDHKRLPFRPTTIQHSAQSFDVAVPNIFKPLPAETAIEENQRRAFDAPPDTPAQAFNLHTDAESRERAIQCLAQVAYYEAGAEGADGERAVVQVVLNRMRHPGFPSSVCGVVYQGSELATGCQFTFTCDGSLLRQPTGGGWKEAKLIAAQALNGDVFAAVGHATHYHGDYVLPYWADSLAKEVQIGRHIFYRLRGALGSSAAFGQHYAGLEPAIPSYVPHVAPLVLSTEQADALIDSRLSANAPAADAPLAANIAHDPPAPLLADQRKSSLLADEGVPQFKRSARKGGDDNDCRGSSVRSQILPASPANLHSTSADSQC